EIKCLEDTNIDAMCRIAELETNLAALAAENAGLKHAMAVTLEHVSVTDAGQAGVAAMIINDALHHSETPATDAFLAEVRAQGVEMFAECAYTLEHHDHAVAFAAELRKGGNQ
ncbi:ead/Ea22-like family protein, partial [Escherichia coli]|nr:ead/Ea22-like family protein [Escherichia coli]